MSTKTPRRKGKEEDRRISVKLPKRMQELTLEQMAAIDNFLIAEGPMDKLIEMIHKEFGMLTDMSYPAIRQMLFRYKARYVVPKQATLVAKMTGDNAALRLAAVTKEIERTLDPLKEMEQVILTQMERVTKLAQLEHKMPSLMDAQTKNMALLADMLAKFTNLKMEVGDILRVPKKLAVAAVDVSEEERAFIESATLADSKAAFLLDAMRLLRDDGVIDVTPTQVRSDDDRVAGD